MPSPVKSETRDGWIIITNDDGSSVLTKDGIAHYLVTPSGCSCGKAQCVHQKLIYPTATVSIPTPKVRIKRKLVPKKLVPKKLVPKKLVPKKLIPKKSVSKQVIPTEAEEESEPFKLPENSFLAGLFVVCVCLSGVLRVIAYVCSAIADVINPMGGNERQ